MNKLLEKILNGVPVRQAIEEEHSIQEAEDLFTNKKFDLAECLGYKCLYTTTRFSSGEVDGVRVYAYDVKGDFETLEAHILQDRNGSCLFLKSIKTPVDISGKFKLLGDQLTVTEFIAIYGTKRKTA